jgi:glycosyltransferase involved in cell wall biosynthesis
VVDVNRQVPGSAPIEISIATYDRESATRSSIIQANEFVKSARELGIAVDVVPERFRFDWRVVSSLREIVERRAPDIIATHNAKSHFLARVCRLHRARPWVAFHHGYTTTDLKMRAYNQLDRWSLLAADRIVTVCGPFAQQLQDRGIPASRIIIQHNSIRPTLPPSACDVYEIRKILLTEGRNRLILAVGRLSREKAHVDLISAFAELHAKHRDVRAKLVIVGEGPERPAIEAAIRAHGLEDDVCLTGQLRDVTHYYAAADIFVLPSHTEGSPYVLLEAMAAGVPIAATAVGGVPEIVTNEETALLVPPANIESLCAAISRILHDAELSKRLAANASTLVSRRYSLESYVHSVLTIYRSLVIGNNKRQLQIV